MSLMEDLKDLDPNDFGRWPTPIRLGAIGLIFLVATIGMAYFLAWKPKKPELDNARAEEVKLMSTLEAYVAQLQEMEQSFGAMLRKLPNKTEVPNLLTDISQQGAGAGLDQKLFQPGAQITKDFYAELPIKMRLNGSFHAIGAFVSGIAALPRIVTLHDVSIVPAGKDAPPDSLQLDVTAKTYRYLDEEEQAAAQPKPTGKGAKKSKKKKAEA